MAVSDQNNTKDSTIVIHFDHDWRFIHLNSWPEDDFVSPTFDDRHWRTIELPHQHNTIDDDSSMSVYWYRKRCDWRHRSDVQQQLIYLNFESIENENNDKNNQKNIQVPGITVWLNENEIFAGTLPAPIELTAQFKPGPNNLFVIRSAQGHSLCLHARLFLPRLCSGQVRFDEPIDHTNKRQRKTLDYTASFNDRDGLIDVFIDSLQKMKIHGLNVQQEADEDTEWEHVTGTEAAESAAALEVGSVPYLSIVMLIVGTRGDVQPFIALGQALLLAGHRVRLATHETFRKFVHENGLEFYPLAGDPADLMSFMVKNAGLIPSVSSIVAGDIAKSRRLLAEILASTWKACIEDDDETGALFVADAIIANPPSFGHIHCAQKLQIPLHIVFTMPWSPTGAFPHPLCKVDYTLGPVDRINFLSYSVVEMVTWSGLRDLINEFRKDKLGLSSLHTLQATRLMIDERVPHTYCWSPSLVPKPNDWPAYIDVSGFFFLDLATNFQPPEDLVKFLRAGDPPIYIGFGSITGHDPRRILQAVLEALSATGYRALLSGLAKENDKLPENVFKIGNCPHDWLFQHVSAVCHHGGAGTTAAGLRAGKPTIIVPFFGDQFFWGSMVSKSGAGPDPIPGKRLNAGDLVEAFKIAHEAGTRAAAKTISDGFQHESGCEAAVRAFYAHLPLNKMRSDLESSYAACYRLNDFNLQISRPVAQVLVVAGAIDESQLTLHSTRDWHVSMHNDHLRLPATGLIKHGRKALSSLFVDTAYGLKRAASSGSLTTGTLDGAETIVKGVGKGIGHAYLGCASLYGEVTDVLERLPSLYDPYSDSDARQRPQVNNFDSGAKAAGQKIWYGFKDGVTGIVNKPRAGFQRHGILGGAAGAAVAVPNIIVKPIVGTLASVTWLSRGIYAEAKNATHRKHSDPENRLSVLSTDEHRRASSSSLDKDEDTTPEARASFISGLSRDVCNKILADFEQIKNEQDLKLLSITEDDASSKVHKSRSKLPRLFRQRSHSATGQ